MGCDADGRVIKGKGYVNGEECVRREAMSAIKA
jgi:hypothetical protein